MLQASSPKRPAHSAESTRSSHKSRRFGVGTDSEVHAAFSSELERWKSWNKGATTLVGASRLFVRHGVPIRPEFVELTRRHYDAPVQSIDFGQSERARRTINTWVDERTRRRIRELLPAGSLHSNTVVVLANALYLKAKWQDPFPKWLTRPTEFELADGRLVDVPTMGIEKTLPYGAADGMELVELPYRDSELAMLIALPQPGQLARVEQTLGSADLTRWTDALGPQSVCLRLPRFSISPRGGIALRAPLSKLGMALAFSAQADFSGMTSDGAVFIDDVYHAAT